MNTDTLVQPILVCKGGGHLDTIAAAAKASVVALYGQDHSPSPSWEPWLEGRFTKTVRRADDTTVDKVVSRALAGGLDVADVRVGGGRAVALAPQLYSDMSRDVRRAQVSGTDFSRTGFVTVGAGGVTVLVDDSLTTGKAAAQAAHALWMWALEYALDNPEMLTEWAHATDELLLNVVVTLTSSAHLADLARNPSERLRLVHDAGLTEIPAGTLTAAVTF